MQAFGQLATRFWHAVARSADVRAGQMIGNGLLDRHLAVWRDGEGRASVVDDI